MNIKDRAITLPECGLFLGSGVYPSAPDYLLSTLYAHQRWQGQGDSPCEMIQKIINDNQGNLAQVWGKSRGPSSESQADWFYALDAIGVNIPPPDWENGKYLNAVKCEELKKHAERFGAGLIQFIKDAADKEIYTTFIYTSAQPEWSQQLSSFGDWYLGYDFGEKFTFRLDDLSTKGKSLKDITLTELADDLVSRVREHVRERKEEGWGRVMATSGNFYIDYEVLGGVDIPLIEDFGFNHLNMASALSRGLLRQHNLPMWGSHLAHEHYSWIPNKSKYKFPLLRASLYQKYMTGSKIIINESGNWFVESTLAVDSPMHNFPRVPIEHSQLNYKAGKDPIISKPFVDEARKQYDQIDYNSPICRQYRKEISDFYDFVKENGTPVGQPETTIAIAKGNLDLCNHKYSPNNPIAGTYELADHFPNWFEGAPERGWDIVKEAFYPLRPVLGEYNNLFLSGSPYGMVDIVSFAKDEITAASLSANYKALLYSGWNTCSKKQYEIIKQYVTDGGTLFISISQLSTNVTRNYGAYSVDELVNGGNFSDLCGVVVRGKGKRFYWATAPLGESRLGFEFPRRFGIMGTSMGDIEITDPAVEILVVDDELAEPILLKRKCGKGTVYFLNSWNYPGALDQDFGPGSNNNSQGLIGMIYRHIAEENRGRVWITDDGDSPGSESEYINFSYFPEAQKVCLQNIDFDHPHQCFLHRDRAKEEMELSPGEFRMVTF